MVEKKELNAFIAKIINFRTQQNVWNIPKAGKAPQSVRKQFRDSFESKISLTQKELSYRDNDGSVFSTQLDETTSVKAYTVPSNCMQIIGMSRNAMDRPMSQMFHYKFRFYKLICKQNI